MFLVKTQKRGRISTTEQFTAKRVLSALEKGGAAWLQAKLINPSASLLVAALEDWQKTKQ